LNTAVRSDDIEETVDQRNLVERASRGDKDAFGLLVVASIAHLESVGRLILRDQELARDAVQDTYLRAWRDLPGLRDPDRFDAWLHRLIVNACLDVLRRRKRRVIEVELSPGDSPNTGDETRGVVDRDQLERCFQRLRPESRSVLVLHYYVGLSTGAIADTLGIPLGTAQSRLHRSRNELRAAISADDRAPATIQERGQPA
jgi:RNA polymerase sigma-70 factor (ECF subfamily)